MKFFSLLICIAVLITCLFACSKGSIDKIGASPATDYSGIVGTFTTGGGASGGGNGDTLQHEAGILTSGEWNDHDNWTFWLGLMNKDTFALAQTEWGFNCMKRWTFTVTDAHGQPVADAIINIKKDNDLHWQCRTNKFGVVRFVPVFEDIQSLPALKYEINWGGNVFAQGVLPQDKTDVVSVLPRAAVLPANADIMFVVDATGSMGDEIEYLKSELSDVLNTAASEVGNVHLRYASVFYRDNVDDYLTRQHDFTDNKNDIVEFVKQQSAEGGGDFPEAVDEALKVAMQQHWSVTAKARILFLVLDAPPHEAAQNIDLIHEDIKEAAANGILIIPIAASGIDKSTEFLLRFMAIATNGTYTFLTDNSGVGDTHLVPTVGPFTVEFLNQQMVRLITKYAGN